MNPLELLSALGRASWMGAFAAMAAGLALSWLGRRIPAEQRAWIWWLVAAHFLLALVPTIHLLSPSTVSHSAFHSVAVPIRTAGERASEMTARIVESPASRTAIPIVPMAWAVLVAWVSGFAVLMLRHVRARGWVERAWRSADSYSPSPAEAALLKEHRRTAGVTPEICTTTEFDVPFTLAGSRPRILLPVECLDLGEEQRMLVLAHECGHVARRDLLFGWVPAGVEACFWFHPFARWAVREYAQAREEACDASALRAVRASSRTYGELLMRFGVVPRSIPSTASCGSTTRSALLRRLLMLDHATVTSRVGRAIGLCLIAAVVMTLLPFRLDAGDPDLEGYKSGVKYESKSDGEREKPMALSVPDDLDIDRFGYLLVAADGKSSNGAMKMSDGDRAREAQHQLGGEIWWFRIGRTGYALNDPEVMDRVRALYDDQDARWRRQLGPYDERLEMLNAQLERLNRQTERLENERVRLDRARASIIDGRDPVEDGDEARLNQIRDSLVDLEAAQRDLYQTREGLFRQANEIHRRRERIYREVEAQDLVFKRRLHEIAQEAVDSGMAQRY